MAGLPKHINGDEGERCSIVRAFMAEVEEHFPGTEVHYWDERLSTVAASRTLIAGDVSRKKRRKVIDKMAAVYFTGIFGSTEYGKSRIKDASGGVH